VGVSLTKQAPGLRAVTVALGWDVRTSTGADFDLDASAIMLADTGKVTSDAHFVFFNNLTSPDGSVEHTGDNPHRRRRRRDDPCTARQRSRLRPGRCGPERQGLRRGPGFPPSSLTHPGTLQQLVRPRRGDALTRWSTRSSSRRSPASVATSGRSGSPADTRSPAVLGHLPLARSWPNSHFQPTARAADTGGVRPAPRRRCAVR